MSACSWPPIHAACLRARADEACCVLNSTARACVVAASPCRTCQVWKESWAVWSDTTCAPLIGKSFLRRWWHRLTSRRRMDASVPLAERDAATFAVVGPAWAPRDESSPLLGSGDAWGTHIGPGWEQRLGLVIVVEGFRG